MHSRWINKHRRLVNSNVTRAIGTACLVPKREFVHYPHKKHSMNKQTFRNEKNKIDVSKISSAASIIHETVSLPEVNIRESDLSFCNQMLLDQKLFHNKILSCRSLYTGIQCLNSWENILKKLDYERLNEIAIYCAYVGDVNAARTVLRHIEDIGDKTYGVLCVMAAYARTSDLEGAKKWFDSSSKYDRQITQSLYSFLIEAHKEASDIEGAFLCLESLKKLGIIPTIEMYNNLLKSCVQFKDLKRAWHLFEYLRLKLFQPNLSTYTTMIRACVESMSTEKAINLFDEAISKNITKNIELYNALMETYISRNDYNMKIPNLFSSIISSNILPNNTTYELLLKSASKKGDEKQLSIILKDFYLKKNNATYSDIFFETPDIYKYIIDTSSTCLETTIPEKFKYEYKQLYNEYNDKDNHSDVISEVTSTQKFKYEYRQLYNEYNDKDNHSNVISEAISTQNNYIAARNKPDKSIATSFNALTDSISYALQPLSNIFTLSLVKVDDHETLIKSIYSVDEENNAYIDNTIARVINVWNYCKFYKTEFINPQLICACIKFLSLCPENMVEHQSVMNVFFHAINHLNTNTPPEIFPLILSWAGNNRKISKLYSQDIFNSYLNFDKSIEQISFKTPRLDIPQVDLALQELQRNRQSRSKEYTRNMFIFMSNVLALDGKINEALELLKKALSFRYDGYLPKTKQEEVLHVFSRCYELACCDEFRPLSTFYTLVVPSTNATLPAPPKKITMPNKKPSNPFLEEPSLDNFSILPVKTPPKEFKPYKFYPSQPKSKRNTNY